MKKNDFSPKKKTKEDILNSDDFANWVWGRWLENELELKFMCKSLFGSTKNAIKEYQESINK